MKKALLVLTFFFLLPNISYADDWLFVHEVGEGKNKQYTYIDVSTIKVVDGYVYFWFMNDYETTAGGANSDKVFNQGDCKKKGIKTLEYVTFTRNMGKGKKIFEFTPPDEWKYPSPETGWYNILDKVCYIVN